MTKREDRAELIKEFQEKFKEAKKQFDLKSDFEEIDECFFITDYILSKGFVSQDILMQMCGVIVDTFYSWNNHMHNLVIPNPQNMMQMSETKMFNEVQKKEILGIIKSSMALVRTYTLLVLNRNKKAEARFIDDSVKLWKKNYAPKILPIMKKIVDEWNKK